LSRKKREARLEAIKTACQAHINGPLLDQLRTHLRAALEAAKIPADSARLEPDPEDRTARAWSFGIRP
jgi:hypothetical protein